MAFLEGSLGGSTIGIQISSSSVAFKLLSVMPLDPGLVLQVFTFCEIIVTSFESSFVVNGEQIDDVLHLGDVLCGGTADGISKSNKYMMLS